MGSFLHVRNESASKTVVNFVEMEDENKVFE